MFDTLSPVAREQLLKLANDLPFFARNTLKILDKTGKKIPFVFNREQKYIHQKVEEHKARHNGRVRIVLVKARQFGGSTYITARFFHKMVFHPGVSAFTLTHLADSTESIFKKVKLFNSDFPEPIKELTPTDEENRTTLSFAESLSTYKVGTAGSRSIGVGTTLQLFHGCLGGDTEILLADGRAKRMREVTCFDTVVTHTGKTAKVAGISRQERDCVVIQCKGLRTLPLIASLDHVFYTKRGWLKVKDLSAADVLGFPVRSIKTTVWKMRFALEKLLPPYNSRRAAPHKAPEKVRLSYDLGWIVGLYLAGGCIDTPKNRSGRLGRVVFALHEKEIPLVMPYFERLKSLFSGCSIQRRKVSRTVTIRVHGQDFAEFINRLCGRKEKKSLPENWPCFPRSFLRGILHGYLRGDGHSEIRTRRISASSIRSAITFRMRDVAAALGYGFASVSFRAGGVRNGRSEQAQYTFRLTGPGVDTLAREIGFSSLRRKRRSSTAIAVSNGYAWVPIIKKSFIGSHIVYDLEIAHEDHSYCTVHGASHNSEVPLWPDAESLARGILQAVADVEGSEVFLEATGRGPGNYFHSMALLGLDPASDYETLFIPWYWHKEYRRPCPGKLDYDAEELELKEAYKLDDEQLYWRRRIIADTLNGDVLMFKQEYPSDIHEAFLSSEGMLFDPKKFLAAHVNARLRDDSMPVVFGVDPGEKRTGFTLRQGRRHIRTWGDNNTDQEHIKGVIAQTIVQEDVDVCFLDYGYGKGILDAFKRDPFFSQIVRGVKFGDDAIQSDIYLTKRAEMYALAKEWVEDQPVYVCPDKALIAEFSVIPKLRPTGRRALLSMVPKEEIIKELKISPDLADSFVLTFAFPVLRRRARVEAGGSVSVPKAKWETRSKAAQLAYRRSG